VTDRPDSDDELDAAYARAHDLADDGSAPSAAVRANVLAAAREFAAQAQARSVPEDGVAPPLAPVAAPVAAVGRGRALAVNLSSWRVRAGAAVCAALLVAMGAWRFDASHRFDGNLQVATASLELAKPPTTALPRDLPAPRLAVASAPNASPPPVVEDRLERTPGANAIAAKAVAHDKDRDVVVAQADQSERAPRPAAPPELRAEARRSPAPAALDAAAPAPVAMAPAAPRAQAPTLAEPPATVVIAASAAPTQVATLPPMPPSVMARRVAVAPAPRPVDIGGVSMRGTAAAAAAPTSLAEANRPVAAAADGAGVRQPSATLQSAADRGDIEALKALLAEPAARVDAPDAAGRTALLHAVLAQQAAAVRLLIAAGADPGRADQAGLTPRAAAQAGANAEIAGLLAAPH
jgi:hypothetical protein